MSRQTVCLTIGGSDSCGGAGIQADLRVFADLGLQACSAVTAWTAQSHHRIARIEAASLAQLDAELHIAFDDYDVLAVKTGMLLDVERIAVVSACLDVRHADKPLVVDPVMVASSGRSLLEASAVEALRATLLQQASLWTPNLDEAAVCLGEAVQDVEQAAQALRDWSGCALLLKGGHGSGDVLRDVLCDDSGQIHVFEHPRQAWDDRRAHGSGCRLASAIAGYVAQGLSMQEACQKSIDWVGRA